VTVNELTDVVWERVAPSLTSIGERVRSNSPALAYTIGRHATEAFPLTAFLSISSTGDTSQESLVLSIGCRLEVSTIRCSADVSTGAGALLVEGPETEVDLSWDENATRREVGQWLESLEQFLVDCHGIVAAALDLKR
jgi:hypothetical protein